jgi:hypothetical protein
MNKLLTEFTDGDSNVKLVRTSKSKFKVVYGSHMACDLPIDAAFEEFGNCVRHSLECAGKLD